MIQISTLEELIKKIPLCNNKEYVNLVQKMDLNIDDLDLNLHFSKETYLRTCVHRSKEFELLLLTWEEGQETAIHCHDGKECWVYVMEGRFEERRYLKDENTDDLELHDKVTVLKDEVSYANKNKMAYHSLKNISSERAVTLHLYKKPIDTCTYFDEDLDKIMEKVLDYDFEEYL